MTTAPAATTPTSGPSGGHRDGGGRGRATPHGCAARVAYGINASGDGDDGEMPKSRADMMV
jgi:hypothetical protein